MQEELSLDSVPGGGSAGLNRDSGAGWVKFELKFRDPRAVLGLERGGINPLLIGGLVTSKQRLWVECELGSGFEVDTIELSSMAKISMLVFTDFLSTWSCNLWDGAADLRMIV